MSRSPLAATLQSALLPASQAGPKRLEEVLRSAGFGNIRYAAETPFNLIIEAGR